PTRRSSDLWRSGPAETLPPRLAGSSAARPVPRPGRHPEAWLRCPVLSVLQHVFGKRLARLSPCRLTVRQHCRDCQAENGGKNQIGNKQRNCPANLGGEVDKLLKSVGYYRRLGSSFPVERPLQSTPCHVLNDCPR